MSKVKTRKLSNPIERYFNSLTRYHYYCFSLLFMSKLPVFWHVLNLIFLSPPMDYYCQSEANSSDSKNQCPCDNPEWDRSVFTETTQTKFGSICDQKWLVSFSESMTFFGTLLGSFFFGFLSDKYGRLSTFCLCSFVIGAAGCLVTIMPTITTFIMMRCIEGIGVGGSIVCSYVLCVEYCGLNHRETVSALYHLPINVSHMSLAGVSYLLRHCDDFQLAISLLMFIFVAMYWIVLESPKWLIDTGRVEKATAVMEKISRFNGISSEEMKTEIERYNTMRVNQKSMKMTFWEIFHHKRLTINFICTAYIFFSCGMGYYGVSQYIGKMSGDIHTNVGISGALLIPGTISAVFLLKLLSRRIFLMSTSFLSGIFMIVVVLIPSNLIWLRVLVAGICNSFFFMSFIIVFLFGVELFPTSIRNSVLGVLAVLSRVGQISAPQINVLREEVSGAIFGTIAIIGGILCYPLPETKDTELPSTLEESQIIMRKTGIRIEETN